MHLPDKKIASIVHFFLRQSQLNINNLRYRRAAKAKKRPLHFYFRHFGG